MKHLQKLALIVCTLLLATVAFAADKSNSVNLTLNNKAVVNGTTLEPGDYKIALDRTGNDVKATFLKAGKPVATAAGHFEERTAQGGGSGVAVGVNDSDRALRQILISKMKGAVVLDNNVAASGGSH
jgi:hypothetical protein